MDFGMALAALKSGNKISREGWNGKNMWLALSPGFTIPADRVYSKPIANYIGDTEGIFRPYIMMKTVNNEFVPWVASQSDLLEEDWFLVDE